MDTVLQIQMLGLPRSGTNFTKELIINNCKENSLQFFDDHDPWKHSVYPPPVEHYKGHFQQISIILLVYKDICSWLESNIVRWQDFDYRILNGEIIDVFEPTVPELTITNDNVFGHQIPLKNYNLANIIKVYNLFHYNWLVKNIWFHHDPNFKKKIIVVPYEDLLYEQNINKFFDVLKSKGVETNTTDYKVPQLGSVKLSERDYPKDHLEKYKNKQTSVLTEYQRQFAYDQLSKEVAAVLNSVNNYQLA